MEEPNTQPIQITPSANRISGSLPVWQAMCLLFEVKICTPDATLPQKPSWLVSGWFLVCARSISGTRKYAGTGGVVC